MSGRELVRLVVPEKFLHSPPAPDLTLWPYDTPIVITMLRERKLEAVSSVTLDGLQAQLDEMTERCRTAEWRAWKCLTAIRNEQVDASEEARKSDLLPVPKRTVGNG